jgi:hypothetical protein
MSKKKVAFTTTAVTFGGFYYYDQGVCKKLHNELGKLNTMYSDAVTLMDKALDEQHFSVYNSEKQIFKITCNEIEWHIKKTKYYLESGIPILRLMVQPKPIERLNYMLWSIAYDEDGDFYESYLDFYIHYVPDTVGSVVYQQIRNKV